MDSFPDTEGIERDGEARVISLQRGDTFVGPGEGKENYRAAFYCCVVSNITGVLRKAPLMARALSAREYRQTGTNKGNAERAIEVT